MFDDSVQRLRSGELSAPEAAERLIAQMDDEELLWLLDGDTPARAVLRLPFARIRAGPFVGGALPRLGIPGIRFSDGPRGVVIGRSTAFPVTIMGHRRGTRRWRNASASPWDGRPVPAAPIIRARFV